MLTAILVPLALAALLYAAALARAAIAARAYGPRLEAMLLGAITNFFDTLGIGSFAPTMAWFKFRRLVADRLIPSTMLVGHTLPTMTQAVIFLVLLGAAVDPVLLVGSVLALLAGGLVGAPLVAAARVHVVQTVVGIALLVAAFFYALSNLGLMPGGGTASTLPPVLLVAAIAGSFGLGILLNFGIGNYAPTLAMLSLMGMDPRLCFPIMAAGAGLTMAGASVRHIRLGAIDLRIVLSMALGGIPAVLIAAFIVKEMPIEWLRWLVCVVVVYAAAVMLRAAALARRAAAAEREAPIRGDP
ncbi:MAG: sulfite exporter TauE/SafE family protein [Pseudomonadota bacterium]|nr:sulfite exporter TauE/SafE family protein [Pseudomonadota bacterium]